MMRPILQLMATEPELLTDHLQSYAELLGEEVGSFQGQFKRHWIMFAVLALLATVTLILGGVALMLWLVTPHAQLQQLQVPWALWLVPLGMGAFCAIIAVIMKQEERTPGFQVLRQQIAADLAMLKQATSS
ncbi:hypothetical protein [Aquabacterium sp. CECT 9606]|jgi:hypothetical protein|uniref:hypothetical protein n=1 Tax=Aquabacterium sp. CECT 9606 TaxID=2845822 RepID=UPI001E465345|nr:hypothetical protein [Aquabacterium sp. CECT 9606]CAH0351469.1 hypothetical protein AQB9606_02131 [Aquabacterium sp. CECT 9606]